MIPYRDYIESIRNVYMSTITIYTDGSCKEFDGIKTSGWGFYGLTPEGLEVEAYGGAGKNVSHNVAELEAAVNALQFSIDEGYKEINLLLDSEYVIQCMNRIDVVEESGYDNIKNAEYRKKLAVLKDIIIEKDISVDFNWNKGHSGIVGNEKADRLAARGVLAEKTNHTKPFISKSVNGVKEEKVKIPDFNSLLTGRRWFFRTNHKHQMEDGRYYYGTTTFEEDKKHGLNYAGKPAPDTHYSLLLTKEPLVQLEKLKSIFDHSITTEITPILIDLNLVKREAIWKELYLHLDTFTNYKSGLLLTPEKEILGQVVKPPRLVWRIADYLDFGFSLIKRYETKSNDLFIYPCSDKFISVSDKGKQEMSKEFKPSDNHIVIPNVVLPNNKKVNILLTSGIDIPTRNQINRMIKDDCKEIIDIRIIIWDWTDKSYRCGMIIERKGDISVYFTSEANYRVIDIKE